VDIIFNRKGEGRGFIEEIKGLGSDFNASRWNMGIFRLFRSCRDFSGDGDDVFVSQSISNPMKWGVLHRIKDELGETIPVANIYKDYAAMITSARDPAG
jgi:hypothetical protein